MTQAKQQQKEPSPDQKATASSKSSVTGRRYTATEQKKIVSLKKKLKRQARLPGYCYTDEWRKIIGPAYPLLGVIVCACDWKSGVWRGQLWLLAEAIGKSERTITDWIRRLKKIDGLEVRYYPYSIAIHLPDRLIPDRSNGVRKPRRKYLELGGIRYRDLRENTRGQQN